MQIITHLSGGLQVEEICHIVNFIRINLWDVNFKLCVQIESQPGKASLTE